MFGISLIIKYIYMATYEKVEDKLKIVEETVQLVSMDGLLATKDAIELEIASANARLAEIHARIDAANQLGIKGKEAVVAEPLADEVIE